MTFEIKSIYARVPENVCAKFEESPEAIPDILGSLEWVRQTDVRVRTNHLFLVGVKFDAPAGSTFNGGS